MHYKYQFTNSVIICLPGLHEALPKMGLCSACVSCLLFIFNDFCQNNYQPILRRIGRVTRIVAVGEQSKVSFSSLKNVAVATNFCWFYWLITPELVLHDIRWVTYDRKCKCCAGQQAHQLTDQLTIISGQLGG